MKHIDEGSKQALGDLLTPHEKYYAYSSAAVILAIGVAVLLVLGVLYMNVPMLCIAATLGALEFYCLLGMAKHVEKVTRKY